MRIIRIPKIPIVFLSMLKLPVTVAVASATEPPTIGITLPIKNFDVLIAIESAELPIEPLILNTAIKTVAASEVHQVAILLISDDNE